MYRWGLALNLRSRLADTRRMFGLLNNDDLDDEWSHNESLLAKDVEKIVHQFERYSLFYPIDKNGFVDLTTGDMHQK